MIYGVVALFTPSFPKQLDYADCICLFPYRVMNSRQMTLDLDWHQGSQFKTRAPFLTALIEHRRCWSICLSRYLLGVLLTRFTEQCRHQLVTICSALSVMNQSVRVRCVGDFPCALIILPLRTYLLIAFKNSCSAFRISLFASPHHYSLHKYPIWFTI